MCFIYKIKLKSIFKEITVKMILSMKLINHVSSMIDLIARTIKNKVKSNSIYFN